VRPLDCRATGLFGLAAVLLITTVAIGETPMPKDIYPDSGYRLPLPKRDGLDEAGQKVFDRYSDPKGGTLAGLRGPGGIRLHSPKLAAVSTGLNRYLRFESGLGGRVRELAILITAREHDSDFEWFQHEKEALKEGVPQAAIDVVKHRRPTDGLDEKDAVIIQLGREMFGRHKVSSETFAKVRKIFGDRGTVDLVSLMGDYAGTAALLTAFDAQLPEGTPPLLPK
jgi:4-carboxymuconolactone decarboxylase